MGTRMRGGTSIGVGTWSGLALSAVALTALVAGTAVTAGPEPGASRSAAAERVPGCPPPGDGAARLDGRARLGGPGGADPNTITPEEAADLDRRLDAAKVTQRAPDPGNPQTVPVVVHVITDANGRGDVPDDVVRRQIEVMNAGFGGTYGGVDSGFRFELAKTTRTASNAWFGDFGSHENEAKRRLRQGGAETLNLYSVDMGQGILGRSTFAQDYESAPRNDGVVIDYRTVPGGGRAKFDLGYTAVHETGHWLGLFHTFQNGCDGPGDYVDDTPYEREQAAGCPEGRDTCASRPGADPVHNFMNYSDDACLNQFTRGQSGRMAQTWAAFRA